MDFEIKKVIHIDIDIIIQALEGSELERLLADYCGLDSNDFEQIDLKKVFFTLGQALVKRYE